MNYKEEIIYDLAEIYIDHKGCEWESFKEIENNILTNFGDLKQHSSLMSTLKVKQIELLIYNFLREKELNKSIDELTHKWYNNYRLRKQLLGGINNEQIQ